jgi:catechol 2,3-dioxygenase-like lactoylglutathione lyase family enzyme
MAVLQRIAPIFAVRDVAESLAYYQRLGFATRAYEGGGYGFATRDSVEIHLGLLHQGDPWAIRGTAYLRVDDADELAAAWRGAGADIRSPEDTPWGQREGVLVDPDGNIIRFGSPVENS